MYDLFYQPTWIKNPNVDLLICALLSLIFCFVCRTFVIRLKVALCCFFICVVWIFKKIEIKISLLKNMHWKGSKLKIHINIKLISYFLHIWLILLFSFCSKLHSSKSDLSAVEDSQIVEEEFGSTVILTVGTWKCDIHLILVFTHRLFRWNWLIWEEQYALTPPVL